MKKVIIVGSGVGGLCSAVRLLHKGYKVKIIEKERKIGGKINLIENDGLSFDLSASIIMTPKTYTDIFGEVGRDYKDYFDMKKLDINYKVFFRDNTSYNLYGDIDKTIYELEKIDSNIRGKYLKFLDKSFEKYNISNYFLEKPMINLSEILNFESIKNLVRLKPFSSTYTYLKRIIKNEKIVDILMFQSMYIGINPYKNTNLYSLIPAISQKYGLYYIKGGMYKYIEALEKLIIEMGGKIEVSNEVEKIEIKDNKVKRIKTKNGTYEADIVICSSDYEYTKNYLIGEIKSENYETNKEYSCSTFIIYLKLKNKYENLQCHNIYINENFRKNIETVFEGNISKNPSMYIYYPEKGHKMNIMVRVPNLKYKSFKKEVCENYKNLIINELSKINEFKDLKENIVSETYFTPVDFKNKFNLVYGNCFGISHKLSQVGFLRPSLKDKKIEGVYYLSSSTHPGNGVSVAINGSKTLAEQIIYDLK